MQNGKGVKEREGDDFYPSSATTAPGDAGAVGEMPGLGSSPKAWFSISNASAPDPGWPAGLPVQVSGPPKSSSVPFPGSPALPPPAFVPSSVPAPAPPEPVRYKCRSSEGGHVPDFLWHPSRATGPVGFCPRVSARIPVDFIALQPPPLPLGVWFPPALQPTGKWTTSPKTRLNHTLVKDVGLGRRRPRSPPASADRIVSGRKDELTELVVTGCSFCKGSPR